MTEIENNDTAIRVGTRIVKQLSTTFYPNPLVIFDELISNAHDALADTVKITLATDKIVIEDNGEGMSHNDLVHFFYIAHSKKPEAKIRKSFKGIKREIIGRFGIGKISLYQVCRRFNIITWQAGTESSATFDFTEFEKNEFIDSFKLKVESTTISNKGHGTRITLLDLRSEAVNSLSKEKVARRLSKTMPMAKGFKIEVNDGSGEEPIVVKSEDIEGSRIKNIYDFGGQVPQVGEVKGKVIFFKREETKEEGVFIRVLGRLVNFDNPKGVLNLNSISHPRQFANKIRVEINADGLNDALLTNRAGFIESHPAYESFVKWLKPAVSAVGEKEYKKWEQVKKDIENLEVPIIVAHAYMYAAESIPQLVVREKEHVNKGHDLMSVIRKGKLKIEIRELNPNADEASFDRERGVIIVNSSNPSYIFAHLHTKIPGVAYHVFKATAVLIALEYARSPNEFKSIYGAISKNVDLLDSMHESLKNKK